MKSALALGRSLLTDGRGRGCNDRLAAFAARQPLIFIQFSPLLARPPARMVHFSSRTAAPQITVIRVSLAAPKPGEEGEGAIVLRLPASTYWEKRRPRDMTTVRNLAVSERGGIDRRHAVAGGGQ